MGRPTLSLPDGGPTLAASAADGDQAGGWPHKASYPSKPSAGRSAVTPSPGSSSTLAVAVADARPSLPRALSGGIGLLAQPRASSKQPSLSDVMPAEGRDNERDERLPAASDPPTTSSAEGGASSAHGPPARPSLLFSPAPLDAPQAPALLDAPSPAPHVARTSPPLASEPQPVRLPSPSLLSATSSESAAPRTPPNLRLEIPPQDGMQPLAGDGLRAPFAPDPENEGICTEVGSLGQEIHLESGDHLNALERIYLYTQSKATFHRIFMSRALPTYLKEVTSVEAVEYVLPLLGGLAIDEEERVKETFVAELLVIIWWFFTTCRLTDQEIEPAPPPDPDAPPPEPDADPPLISVQSFSAVLASLLLSNIPSVSATARGTVVELLGRARWIVSHPDQTDMQYTQYCEAMRPVGGWEVGLLGPEQARMIQLEIIYSVVIDLGRLDLNAEEEMAAEVEGEYEAPYDVERNVSQEDLTTLEDPTTTTTAPLTLSASDFPKSGIMSLSDSALTPTPTNDKSYVDAMTRSVPTPRSGSAPAVGAMSPRTNGIVGGGSTNGMMSGTDSSSSLNLPELSPADSSSRSSVASPAEPISPPEGTGADYVEAGQSSTDPSSLPIPPAGFKSSAPSTPGTDDLELSWHTANNSEADLVDGSGNGNGAGAGAGTGFLTVPRPGLARGLSTISVATSGIDPEDYADAQEWDDGPEVNGVDMSGVDVEVGGADADEAATEVGDPPAEAEMVPDDAYIDDGAAAEEAAIGRVASMSLISAVTSNGVVDEEIYTLFVEEVTRVSADPVYWVRSETSYALGTLAKAVGEGSVEPYLLPILESLMTDTEAHVRQASVFAIPSVLRRLPPNRRREIAARYMLKLCEDDAESVKTGALQVLAEVIHTFCDDQDGPPSELLDFFLQGEHNQAHASLPAPTPPPSQDNIWSEPSSYFPAEPSFPDPDRALICAFNLPAVALTLGPARWSRISGYYTYLASESWHTPKVRSTLAASTGEIAKIVGPAVARRDIVPVWWTCLSGGERDAKIKALNALPLLLESLDSDGRAEVARKMGEAWAEGGCVAGWKEREAFAKQLTSAARLLKDQGAVLCRIFRSGLEDRVAATREAVVAAVPVLHEVLEDDKVHTRIARDDLFALATSGTYRFRTTFLACCRMLIESPRGAWILDEPRFGSNVSSLAAHSVVDVRIGVGRLLTSICERHTPRRNQRPTWLTESLERLSLDPSPDVRSYVHRATYSDMLEPRPPVDAPEARPASLEFAEFSRPP